MLAPDLNMGDWALVRPSDYAQQKVAQATLAVAGSRVAAALHAAMDIVRCQIPEVGHKDGEAPLITPQEWVDLVWVIAAWMISRHPIETLHFRLYMHFRYTLGFTAEDTTEILSKAAGPLDTDFTPLQSVTVQ